MTKKLTLKIEDLEDRIAPALLLPNGDLIFSNFDNAAPGDLHPSFGRDGAAYAATTDYNGPIVLGGFNEGPWSATVVAPPIDLSFG